MINNDKTISVDGTDHVTEYRIVSTGSVVTKSEYSPAQLSAGAAGAAGDMTAAEEEEESKFQYILAAPTSIQTKPGDPSLTYINQGQSYEIKIKKLGDISGKHNLNQG